MSTAKSHNRADSFVGPPAPTVEQRLRELADELGFSLVLADGLPLEGTGYAPREDSEIEFRYVNFVVREYWRRATRLGWQLSPPQFPPDEPAEIQTVAEERNAIRGLLAWASATLARLAGPPNPTIWFHGNRSYSSDGVNQVVVSQEAHCILQAFLEHDTALDTRDLENKSGITNAARAVADLCRTQKCFVQAIRTPDQKGAGYYIRVRPAKDQNRPAKSVS